MEHFKLIFNRFDGDTIQAGNIKIATTYEVVGEKEAEQSVDSYAKAVEKAAQSNDKLNASLSSTKTSFKTVSENAVRAYNDKFAVLKEGLASDKVSTATKGRIQKALGKSKSQGLDNLKISQGANLSKSQYNKVLSGNAQAGSIMSAISKDVAKYDISNMTGGTAGSSFIGNSEEINKETSSLQKLSTAMASVDAIQNKITGGFKNFINSLKSVAITWRIIGGFLRGIVNIFANLYEATASYEEALNLFTVSMGENAEAANKWIETISTPLYLDPKDIMQYAGAFKNLTYGLGASASASNLMAKNLTQLSYDMSSYLNMDVANAQAKIQSAITGQARAVASAGVAMQQASLQELAYELQLKDTTVALDDNTLEMVRNSIGIKKSVKDMTQAEKTYLRYIQIMRSTTHMQGDLARTLVTPENALRAVKTQFNLLAREMGSVFIPIAMKVIPYVMVLTQALQRLAHWLGKKMGYEIADINYDSLKNTATGLKNLGDYAEEAAGKTGKAADSINRSLAPFDELNVVESESSGGTGGVGGGGFGGNSVIPDLEEYLTDYDMLEGLTKDFENNINKAKENLEKLAPIMATLGGIFVGWKIAKSFVDNLIKVQETLDKINPKSVETLMDKLGSSEVSGTLTSVATIVALVAQIYANFKSVNDETDRFKEAWESGDWGEYFKIDSIDELCDKVRTLTFILEGGLPAALVIAGNKLGWFDGIIKNVKESFKKLWEFIKEKAEDIGKYLKEHIGDRFQKIYDENIKPTIDDIKDLWNDTLKPVFDKAKEEFNKVIGKIKDFLERTELLKNGLKLAAELIKKSFVNFMNSDFALAIDFVKGKVETFIDRIEGITGVVRNVVKILKGIKDGDWSQVWEGFKGIITNVFKTIASPIARPMSTVLKAIEKAINAAINAIGKLIDQINKLDVTNPVTGKKILDMNLPKPSTISIDTSTLDNIASLKTGMDFVPRDYYGPVYLDYGERVLTKEENRRYMQGNTDYLSNLASSSSANNTALASDIANAIVESMKLAEASRQPGITQVYIGNEKVYEGQGEYQSRQTDRYGTSYVQV